jgi:hypothetical protein
MRGFASSRIDRDAVGLRPDGERPRAADITRRVPRLDHCDSDDWVMVTGTPFEIVWYTTQ